MLRIANTSKVSVLLAGLLLALSVLFSGGSAQAAAKPNIDLQAPLGGEVFAPDQEFLIKVAPQGKVLNMAFDLVVRDAAGTELGTVSLTGQSNVKPFKLKLHLIERTIPINVLFPSSHVLLRVTATTKLGDEVFTSGEFIVGSPGLLPNSVDTTHIIDGQVKTDDIGDGEVRTADILDGGIATVDIADNAIDGNKLASSALNDALRAVNTDHIRDGAVTSAKFGNNSVTSAKLQSDAAVDANRAVTTDHIRDNAISTAKIASQAVTPAKLQQATGGQLLVGQDIGNSVEYKTLSGDATLAKDGTLTIGANTLEGGEIDDLAIVANKLAPASAGAVLVGQGAGVSPDYKLITGDASLTSAGLLTINSTFHTDAEIKDVSKVGVTTPSLITLTSTTDDLNSGAFLVGTSNSWVNVAGSNVQAVLDSIDAQLTVAKQNVFTSVNAVITANSPTTNLNIAATAPLTVANDNTTKTVTLALPDGTLDGDNFSAIIAGDGLSLGGSPTALNVNVGAGLEINADAVRVKDDSIDGGQLANPIVVDDSTWTFQFNDNAAPRMLMNFAQLDGTSNVPVFRLTRGTAPATTIFTVDSDGDTSIVGTLGVTGQSTFSALTTAAAGLSVTGADLTVGSPVRFSVDDATGNVVSSGSIQAASINVQTLASNTDFTLQVDADQGTTPDASSFIVKNGSNATIFQVNESAIVTGIADLTASGTVAANALSATTSVTTGTPAAGPGLEGRVIFNDANNLTTFNGKIIAPASFGADRTFTLPDNTGTLALTSDISSAVAAPLADNNTLRAQGTQWVNNANFTATAAGAVTAVSFAGNGSALTNLEAGDIATGTLALLRGGTGLSIDGTTLTDGQLLIGNNAGDSFSVAALTGTANQVVVTNGAGSITLSTPQDIGTASTVTFGSVIAAGVDNGLISSRNTANDETATNVVKLRVRNAANLANLFSVDSEGDVTANSFAGNGSALTNLEAGDISAGTLAQARGGTGVDGTTATDGQLLIGDTGTGLALATLSQGANNGVTVTNGASSITLDTAQDIRTTASPTFAGLTVGKTVLSAVTETFDAAAETVDMSSSSRLNLGDGASTLSGGTVELTGTTDGQLIVVKNFDSDDAATIQIGTFNSTVTVGPGASALILVIGANDLDQL